MSKRKHRVRRGGIAVIPIVISIIFSLLIPVNVTAESFFASLQVIIGVWATLLGFIITTVSILLTFTGSKLTEEIKATGHYKTILFSYLLTCFELLIFLGSLSIVGVGFVKIPPQFYEKGPFYV